MNLFQGRRLAIATKHNKENVIGPKIASTLGVLPFVPENLDTDQLGTFTGEVERQADPLTTARKKCEMAMASTGCDLAIASEGSFGMHPALMFVPCDEELVLLVDKKNDLEIVGRKLSTHTNYGGQWCKSTEEVTSFAQQANFPSHALILRSDRSPQALIFKGISESRDLLRKFQVIIDTYDQVFIETDMRALYNPTRMGVIAEATDALLERAVSQCKKCQMPGFGVTDVKTGLRCMQCHLPTQSIKAYIYSCSRCGFTREQPNPNKSFEEPMYCDYCNP